MAILLNNPFGKTKGILGNTYLRTTNGKTVVVSRSKRSNGNNSEGELCRKRKFSITASFSKHVCRLNLLKEVWGPGYSHDVQYLRVFMAGLRRKIEADPAQPKYLTTEQGVGYRLVEE